jgi:hypothetical protein
MHFFRKLTNYFYNRPKIINKIAFFINEEFTLQHYENIINKLKIDNFVIILTGKFKYDRYKKFVNKLKSFNYNIVFLDDVLYLKKYKILLTHVKLGGDTIVAETLLSKFKLSLIKLLKKVGFNIFKLKNQQFIPKKIGIYNIKFMYGMDFNFKYSDYDNLFDEFFCHGPIDSEFYKKNFSAKIFNMGYPRYDNYLKFRDDKDVKKDYLKKYLCSPKKPTILWICTTSEFFSTIVTYERYIEMLIDKYNVILRPHPIEINPTQRRFNQKAFDIVNSKKFILNIDPSQNMEELYLISDYVFCDYGGSIFSALYCNKNILLLNHKNDIYDANIRKTTSLEIRNYLPSINESDCNKDFTKTIDNILSSSKITYQTKNARKIYFGDQINQNCSKFTSDRLRKYLN